jgi:hypothetical protein
MKTYYSIRVVRANSKEEAIGLIEDGQFAEDHPLCDRVSESLPKFESLLSMKEYNIYYLFGSDACRVYYNSDGNRSIPDIAKEISKHEHGLFIYDNTETHPTDLLNSYDGWGGFAEISKELYIELTNINTTID